MKPLRRSHTPKAIRTRLVRLLEEIAELESETNPLAVREMVAAVIPEIGNHLVHGGFSELYEESLKLVRPIKASDGVEYVPIADVAETKSFLAKCLREIDRRIQAEMEPAAEAPAGDLQDSGYEPSTREGRKRNHIPRYTPPKHLEAYKQYKEAEKYHGGHLSDRAAYRWLHLKYRDLPDYETWTRYVRGGRRAFNDKKNYPRHGRRYGRSIVRASQI